MQVAVERRPGSQVALTITVEPAVLEQRMEELFQRHARRVTIPGFRPGKAPRKMLEERIPRSALLQDAIEDVIDATYKQALTEQELQPLERGEIEDVKTAEDLTLTYVVRVSVRPEVTLADYSKLVVKHTPTQVADDQVEAEIERLRERTSDFSEVTDEGIETGDYVTIDYTMTVDGEAYPEGDTTGYPLEVGSDTFFPELNEGLLELKQGETKTISHSYPEDYTNADLAGKTAEFAVTVQQVRRMRKPEATDAWAQMISQGSIENVEQLRERLQHNLQVMAQQADQDAIRGQLVSQVVEQSQLEIPDTLVEEEYEHLMHDLEHRLSQERMGLEEYAEMINRSVEDIKNEQMLLARDLVRRSLVLQEIARRERIVVSDEDINALLAGAAPGESDVRKVRKELEKSGRLDQLMSRIFHEKVLSFLQSHADVQEGDAAAPATEAASAEEAPAKEKKPRRTKKSKEAAEESSDESAS